MCFSSVLVLRSFFFFFFFNDTATTEIYTLSLHDALPISLGEKLRYDARPKHGATSHGLLAPRANFTAYLTALRPPYRPYGAALKQTGIRGHAGMSSFATQARIKRNS